MARKRRKPKRPARADKAGGQNRSAGKQAGEQQPGDGRRSAHVEGATSGKSDDRKVDAEKAKDKAIKAAFHGIQEDDYEICIPGTGPANPPKVLDETKTLAENGVADGTTLKSRKKP